MYAIIENGHSCLQFDFTKWSNVRLIRFTDNIDDIIVSMAPSMVDGGFDTQSGQSIYCKVSLWCFFVKHIDIRRKNKDLVMVMCSSLQRDYYCFSKLAL